MQVRVGELGIIEKIVYYYSGTCSAEESVCDSPDNKFYNFAT